MLESGCRNRDDVGEYCIVASRICLSIWMALAIWLTGPYCVCPLKECCWGDIEWVGIWTRRAPLSLKSMSTAFKGLCWRVWVPLIRRSMSIAFKGLCWLFLRSVLTAWLMSCWLGCWPTGCTILLGWLTDMDGGIFDRTSYYLFWAHMSKPTA